MRSDSVAVEWGSRRREGGSRGGRESEFQEGCVCGGIYI